MTTYTWPSTAAHPWYLLRQNLRTYHNNRSSVSPLSGYTQTLALPGARWGWAVDFPEHTYAERAQLEGFFARLNGNEHRLQLWDMTRPRPLGNLNVSGVTLGASAAQFASSLVLAGCRGADNLLLNAGFETDSNADGLANGWSSYTSGSVGSVANTLSSGDLGLGVSSVHQVCQSSALDGRVGVVHDANIAVTPGQSYTFSAYQTATGGTVRALAINWLTAGLAFVSESTASLAANGRLVCTGVAPPTAAFAKLYVWAESTAGAGVLLNVDAAQFQPGTLATAWRGLPGIKAGDWLGVGGQLLMAAEDATATDAGAMTVPVRHMLRAAAASGAAVTLDKPTGLFIMAEPAMEWPRGAGNLTPEASVELVEVFA